MSLLNCRTSSDPPFESLLQNHIENPGNVIVCKENYSEKLLTQLKRYAAACKAAGSLAIMQISHVRFAFITSCLFWELIKLDKLPNESLAKLSFCEFCFEYEYNIENVDIAFYEYFIILWILRILCIAVTLLLC